MFLDAKITVPWTELPSHCDSPACRGCIMLAVSASGVRRINLCMFAITMTGYTGNNSLITIPVPSDMIFRA
jgi:hypothetical protein